MNIKYYNEKILIDEFKKWHKKMYFTDNVTEDEIDHFLAKKWLEIENDLGDNRAAEDIILKFRKILVKKGGN